MRRSTGFGRVMAAFFIASGIVAAGAWADYHMNDYCANPDVWQYYNIPLGRSQQNFEIIFNQDDYDDPPCTIDPGGTFHAAATLGYDCDVLDKGYSHCSGCTSYQKCFESWDNSNVSWEWMVTGYVLSAVPDTSPVQPPLFDTNLDYWITAFPEQIEGSTSITISVRRDEAGAATDNTIPKDWHRESPIVIPAPVRAFACGAHPNVPFGPEEATVLLYAFTSELLYDEDGPEFAGAGGGAHDSHIGRYYRVSTQYSNFADTTCSEFIEGGNDTWWYQKTNYKLILVKSIYGGTVPGVTTSGGPMAMATVAPPGDLGRRFGHLLGRNGQLVVQSGIEWNDNIMYLDFDAPGRYIRSFQQEPYIY